MRLTLLVLRGVSYGARQSAVVIRDFESAATPLFSMPRWPWRHLGVRLSLLLIVAACKRPLYVGTDGIRVGSDKPKAAPTPRVGKTRSGATVTQKRVASKEAPSTLVADDKTRCTVSGERFSEIQSGDYVACAWQGTDD